MNKILEIKFGSHLYGTNTPESDLDLKSLYLPDAKQICLGKYKRVDNISRAKEDCERNTKDDTDIEIFSLDRFVNDLMDGQTWALDMLFAPNASYTHCTEQGYEIMAEIFSNRTRLLSRNVNAFVGYARQQAAKYGIKGTRMDSLKRVMALLEPLPLRDKLEQHAEAIYALVKETESLVSLEKTPLIQVVPILGPDKKTPLPHLKVCGRNISFTANVKLAKDCFGKILEGYGQRAEKAHLSGGKDYKALSHAVRVNGEALELLATGFITFPRPDREILLAIKTEKVPFDEVSEMIETGLVNLYEAQEKSGLRAEPDREWADEFLYRVYSEIVKSS